MTFLYFHGQQETSLRVKFLFEKPPTDRGLGEGRAYLYFRFPPSLSRRQMKVVCREIPISTCKSPCKCEGGVRGEGGYICVLVGVGGFM